MRAALASVAVVALCGDDDRLTRPPSYHPTKQPQINIARPATMSYILEPARSGRSSCKVSELGRWRAVDDPILDRPGRPRACASGRPYAPDPIQRAHQLHRYTQRQALSLAHTLGFTSTYPH